MKLSIIIPAYNEEDTLKDVIMRIKSLNLPRRVRKDIIVIDDGSTDKTNKIASSISGVRTVSNQTNRGKGYSIRIGIQESLGDIIVIQDADMEYDPKEIPILLESILDGHDVVYGSRFMGNIKGMSKSHNIGNNIISFSTSILYGNHLTDTETGYKMIKKKVLDKIVLGSNGFDIETEITAKILKSGYLIKEIPISYKGRPKSKKKIGYKDGFYAIWSLLKFRFKD